MKAPTLVMDGGASLGPAPFMRATADKLGKTIPGAKRRVIEGEDHDVSSKVLAPILEKFFATSAHQAMLTTIFPTNGAVP